MLAMRRRELAALGAPFLHRVWWGQAHPRIPSRPGVEPGQGLGAESFHREVRQHVVVIALEGADPSIGQNHVGVEDLPGKRMHSARPDRQPNVVRQPTNEVVANVFGVLFHVGAGGRVLVIDLDGVGVPTFRGGVPIERCRTTMALASVLDKKRSVLRRADRR